MADSTNQTPSEDVQEKVNSGFNFDPELSKNYFAEGPFPTFAQNIGGFNLTAYEFPDGSEGFAIYNGKVALHFDNNNNVTIAAGPPGQSGCGGKMITNVQQQLTKAKSVVVEVTGRDDGGTVEKKTDENGDVEEENLPSYSLKVYGPCKIESVGGDVAIKGDNITLNASNTLNLKSNKDINIQAGTNGGKINMSSGSVNMEAGFFNKKLSGGDFTDGAGEVRVTQNKSGSSVTYETPGDVRYIVNGDYTVGVKKNYKLNVTGNYIVNVDKDYGFKVLGDYASVVSGKALFKVNGTASKSKQTQNFLVDTLLNKKKGLPDFELNTLGLVQFTTRDTGYKFEVGKALGTLNIEPSKFEATAGPKLGALLLDKKSSTLKWGEKSKLSLEAAATRLTGPLLYLN